MFAGKNLHKMMQKKLHVLIKLKKAWCCVLKVDACTVAKQTYFIVASQ